MALAKWIAASRDENACMDVGFRFNMAAFRAIVNKCYPDNEDSCMSCLTTTKYCCQSCKWALCNKCSVPEENEETSGWKHGKSIAYCEPCWKDVGGNNGGKPKPNLTQRRSVSPHLYVIISP